MAPGTDSWIVFAGLTLVFWGLWGFLYKIATEEIAYQGVLFYGIVGAFVANVIVLAVIGRPETSLFGGGAPYALIGGAVGALGGLTFMLAVNAGKISLVAPMTALYPVVTILLGVFILQETVSLTKVVGVLSALAAMVLLSI